jgi:rubredoxin
MATLYCKNCSFMYMNKCSKNGQTVNPGTACRLGLKE